MNTLNHLQDEICVDTIVFPCFVTNAAKLSVNGSLFFSLCLMEGKNEFVVATFIVFFHVFRHAMNNVTMESRRR